MKRHLYQLLLLADNQPTFWEKVCYVFSLTGILTPVAYVMSGLNVWFKTNQQFSSFVLVCLIINLVVGTWFHKKMKTFDWKLFFIKNSQMWLILIIVYALLEMLRLTAGDNYIGNGFKILIQVTTLLYPISKALKNLYILSKKQFPPAFIMERVYNFEKNGNLKELFDTEKPKE